MPAALFNVTSGKRHRFRAVFGGETSTCQVQLSVESHQILVIALDGHSIIPKTVASVRLSSGKQSRLVSLSFPVPVNLIRSSASRRTS